MGLSLKIRRNDISPTLSRLARTAKDPTPVLRAMGTTFKSITEGNFNSAGAQYRPKDWPAKKDGTPSILQKSTTLVKAFHLEVTSQYAKVSNPMVYAAIHQFGARDHKAGKAVGSIKTKYANPNFKGSWNVITSGGHGIPPRPFFPVLDGKLTVKAEERIRDAGERVIQKQLGS